MLVCGGDGSVSWVLNEIDRLGRQKQVHWLVCQTKFIKYLSLCSCVCILRMLIAYNKINLSGVVTAV